MVRQKIVDRSFNGRWRVADIRAMLTWVAADGHMMTRDYLASVLHISVDRLRRILRRSDDVIVNLPRSLDQVFSTTGYQSPSIDWARHRLIFPESKKGDWVEEEETLVKQFRARK